MGKLFVDEVVKTDRELRLGQSENGDNEVTFVWLLRALLEVL